MVIDVQVFGPIRRRLGRSSAAIVLEEASPTCRRLRDALEKCEPGLAAFLPACRLAVNHEFATEEQVIQPGDEVALIGLVSGG